MRSRRPFSLLPLARRLAPEPPGSYPHLNRYRRPPAAGATVPMPADFLSLLSERVLILDGAMGTSIHRFNPTDADWGGAAQVNNCDYVAVTHPEWIYQIHAGF